MLQKAVRKGEQGLCARGCSHASHWRMLPAGHVFTQHFRLIQDMAARSRATFPTGDSFTPRFVRTNKGSPNSVSSALTWWLTADWVKFRRSAALVKLMFPPQPGMFEVARVPSRIPTIVSVINEGNDRQYNNELAMGTGISVRYVWWRFC